MVPVEPLPAGAMRNAGSITKKHLAKIEARAKDPVPSLKHRRAGYAHLRVSEWDLSAGTSVNCRLCNLLLLRICRIAPFLYVVQEPKKHPP